MPLRTTLEHFLNHVETLETKKSEGHDLYEKEFKLLKSLTERLRTLPQYSTRHGTSDANRRKNRYKDIVPYDYTRVVLSPTPGVPNCEYINASYIKGASGSMAYIASQGPLPSTVEDFWRMIWECEIQVIIMACNEIESGKHKCEKYWPEFDEEKQYGHMKIKMVREKQVCPQFVVRTMTAITEKDERTIVQFHYVSWPDHGIPDSVKPILKMVKLIRDCQASETVPILVHCSAGCGRTGTICAIDYVWGLLRTGKLTDSFSLYKLVASMRKQRIAMVQTKDQYVLVYSAVKELFEHHLKVMDSHLYENIDFSGTPISLLENDYNFIDDDENSDEYLLKNKSLTQSNDNLACKVNEKNDKNEQHSGRSSNESTLTKSQHGGSSLSDSKPEMGSNSSNEIDANLERSHYDDAKHHHYENVSTYSSSTSLTPSPTDQDAQHPERAVIVRKPSIARLRAIFEKSNAPDDHPQAVQEDSQKVVPKRSKRVEKSKKFEASGARYRDTALTVYSELRRKEGEDADVSPLSDSVPFLESPSSPDFIRRGHGKRSSIHRTPSSIWYAEDGNEMQKNVDGAENEKEKPALPVKLNKSLKVSKLKGEQKEEEEEDDDDDVGEASNDNRHHDSSDETKKNENVLELPLSKGIVKLKSSPWNPRRSQNNKSTENKSPESKTPTKDKTKSWYFFGDKQSPEVVAGSENPSVQLVRVKSNADEFQPIKIAHNTTTPRGKTAITIDYDDKPPPLPIKTCSPMNSPRLRHQQNLPSPSGQPSSDSPISPSSMCTDHAKGNATKSSGYEDARAHCKEKLAAPTLGNFPVGAPESSSTLNEDTAINYYNASMNYCISYSPDLAKDNSSVSVVEIDPKRDPSSKIEIHVPFERRGKNSDVDYLRPSEDSGEQTYQQIIQDCQDYLLTTGGYTNVFPKMYENLNLIENSVQKHPRGGIVDLLSGTDTAKCDARHITSSSSPVPEEFYMAEDVQQLLREIEADGPIVSKSENSATTEETIKKCPKLKKDYEHLWLSRTGTCEQLNDSNGNPSELHQMPALSSYKIVQEILQKQNLDDNESTYIPRDTEIPKKARKPQPLPRKNIPAKMKDVDLELNFSSESNEDETATDCTIIVGEATERRKIICGAADEIPDSLYSEICKDKTNNKLIPHRQFHRRSKDDMELIPSAPPRLKRQLSLQQPKKSSQLEDIYPWRHTLPGRFPVYNKNVKLKAKENRWGSDWDSDEDCTPPVPEKTREAYMIPGEVHEGFKSSREHTRNGGDKLHVSTSRSFPKFSILSKLGLKAEHKGSEGLVPTAKRQHSSTENAFLDPGIEIGFPHRLPRKPRGPRSVPPEWCSNNTKVTS